MVSAPLSPSVGAYVRFRTQVLPVLTEAQLKLPGPLQPAGSVAKVPVIANPEMALPSFEVNVILTVWVAPTATETALSDGVATTESLLPVSPPPPGAGGAPPLVVPALLA